MKNKNLVLILVVSTLLIGFGGCYKSHGISGNNQVVTETRQMHSFDKIVNEGSFNIFIMQDSIFQVVVEAESNLIPYIRTLVNGNTLIIDTRENLSNHSPMNIYVKTPTLFGVDLQGSGFMNLDSLNTDHLQLEINGSGDINGEVVANSVNATISGSGSIFLSAHTNTIDTQISGSGILDLNGEANKGTHTISGSGNINAYNFLQKECHAKISGSGNMYLNVSDLLDATISGNGSVFYIGNPEVTVHITGSGSVIHQ